MPNALMMRQMEWQTEQKKTQAYDPRTHESGRLTAQKMPLQRCLFNHLLSPAATIILQ
jgi:hypothetical protein